MRRTLLCTALLLAIGLLAGCGNKGPLVLPTRSGSAVAPAASAPAAAASAPLPG